MSNDKQRYVVKAASEMREGEWCIPFGSYRESADNVAGWLNSGTTGPECWVWRAFDPEHDVYVVVDTQRPLATVLGAEVKASDLTDSTAFHDPVASPSHYRLASGVECLDVIEGLDMNYHRGSAFAYVWRAGRKGGPEQEVEDLEKAVFYLQREIERLKAVRK